jgi:hypothetical protein
MSRPVRDVAPRLARKGRQLSSPAAWQAAAAKRVWKARGACPPPPVEPRLSDAVARVHWPSQYEWPHAARWVLPIREGLSGLADVSTRTIAQPYEGIVLFEAAFATDPPQLVAIDYYDYTFVNERCLSEVAVYFKMQHLRDGYGDPRIVPGGYVASNRSVYDHYCRLRALSDRGPRSDVYGRFGTRYGADIRRQAVQALERQTRFGYTGGTSLVSHMQSMREAARARVCLDLPGNGPLCHRLVDYLAIGACVVAPRHAAVLPEGLHDGEHIVFCRADLADLVELCARYVEDEGARARIGEGAARFFDEHLQRAQLAGYYLRTLEQRLGPESRASP